MLSSLTSAVSGLDDFQEEMNVIGNNIANVDTTGFKAGVVDFADAFNNTMRALTSNTNGIQVGTGVTITAINSNWNQGALSPNGIPSNLAISGNGFFMVRDTQTNAQYATRAGDFSVDSQGYLITDTGERVQGYSDAGLTTLGDIKIDTTGEPATADPNATVTSFSINTKGVLSVTLSDGTTFQRGQVLMQNFQDPNALVSVGNNLFTNLPEAGPLAALAAPGSSGLGNIQSGALELSNVDLSNEMAGLITAQRAFEANSKIVTASDEVLQTVVNMKR